MKPLIPLQGTKRFTFYLASALVLGLCLILTQTALASDTNDAEYNVRKLEATHENIQENVQLVQRIFQNLEGDLSVSGSLRQIRAATADLTSTGLQLARLFGEFLSDISQIEVRRETGSTALQLGENAASLQRLLQPAGISRVQDVNLRDVHFALNTILSGTDRLSRMLQVNPNEQVSDGVTLDAITTSFRVISTYVNEIQTISQSIETGGIASTEAIREVTGLLESAQSEATQFGRMMVVYGTELGHRERLIRAMVEITQQISHQLDRIIHALTPEEERAENGLTVRISLENFNDAISDVMNQIRKLRRGILALSGEASEDDFFAEPDVVDEASPLARFDLNNNCEIDNAEILYALELWISRKIDRSLFMDVVDAWTTGEEVCDVPDPFGSVEPAAKLYLSTSQTHNRIVFSIQGQSINLTQIQIFDVSGAKIKTERADGSRIVWNLRSEQGYRVSNGVYFYIPTFTTNDGNIIRGPVKKFAVLR